MSPAFKKKPTRWNCTDQKNKRNFNGRVLGLLVSCCSFSRTKQFLSHLSNRLRYSGEGAYSGDSSAPTNQKAPLKYYWTSVRRKKIRIVKAEMFSISYDCC